MCHDYGTPYRFSQVHRHGARFALECHEKSDLIDIIRQEMAAGYYTQEHFHPLLIAMLQALATNHAALPQSLQEPQYPFCDLIQCTGMMFGFYNGSSKPLVPQPDLQDYVLQGGGLEGTSVTVYAISRVIVTTICPPIISDTWYPHMFNGKTREQAARLLFAEVGLRNDMIQLMPAQGMADDHHAHT